MASVRLPAAELQSVHGLAPAVGLARVALDIGAVHRPVEHDGEHVPSRVDGVAVVGVAHAEGGDRGGAEAAL